MRGTAIVVILLLGACSGRAGGAAATETGDTGATETGDDGGSTETGGGDESTSTDDGPNDDGLLPDFEDGAACEPYVGRVDVSVEPSVLELGMPCFGDGCDDECVVGSYMPGPGTWQLALDCAELGPVSVSVDGASTVDVELMPGELLGLTARAEYFLGIGFWRFDLSRPPGDGMDSQLVFAAFQGSDDGYTDIATQLRFDDIAVTTEEVCVWSAEPCGQHPSLGFDFRDGAQQFYATPWNDVGSVSGYRIVVNDAFANPNPCATDTPPQWADVVAFGPVGG